MAIVAILISSSLAFVAALLAVVFNGAGLGSAVMIYFGGALGLATMLMLNTLLMDRAPVERRRTPRPSF
jgi:hypothetical protein